MSQPSLGSCCGHEFISQIVWCEVFLNITPLCVFFNNLLTPSIASVRRVLPRGLFGRSLQLCHHMQEVVTEEDPPLQQQKEETDTVPDDPGLFYWKAARLVTHCFRCQEKTNTLYDTYLDKKVFCRTQPSGTASLRCQCCYLTDTTITAIKQPSNTESSSSRIIWKGGSSLYYLITNHYQISQNIQYETQCNNTSPLHNDINIIPNIYMAIVVYYYYY